MKHLSSHRQRFKRLPINCFAKLANHFRRFIPRLCFPQFLWIKQSPRDIFNAKRPQHRHQWVDEQLRILCARSRMIIAEVPSNGIENRRVDDARLARHFRENVLARSLVELDFGHIGEQRTHAQKAAGARNVRDCFQKLRVTHAMKSVHAKANAHQKLRCDVEFLRGLKTRHIFDGRAQTGFVATHERISAAVYQHERVGLQVVAERAIICPKRRGSLIWKTENRGFNVLSAQPSHQMKFGEIRFVRDGFGRHFEQARRMPFFIRARKVGKRQVRQMNRFALRAKRVEKRQAAKDVITPARAREQNGLRVAQFVEERKRIEVHKHVRIGFSFG